MLVWKVSLVIAALCAVEFVAILAVNGGHFTFSLDDPYIHLAMAEEILRGHYGINPGEPAAAASSIVYPFLLAPLLTLGFGQFSALAINVAAALGAGFFACGLLTEARLPVARLPRVGIAIAAILLGVNLITLVFSGLEHTLQVADALACVWGLTRFLDSKRVPFWWIAALIAAPLIRYEGASLLAAGVLVMLLRGEWKWAAVAGVTGFGLIGGFSAFLIHLGLPPLPSSVLVKSSGAASGVQNDMFSFIGILFTSLGENIQDPRAVIFIIGILLAGLPFLRAVRRSSRPSLWEDRALVGFFCIFVIFAHLALGAFGWFARYEIYVLVIALGGVTVIYRDAIEARFVRATAAEVSYFALAFLLLFIRNVATISATVGAANNIHEQQYQMHRFVTEVYRAPVTVNDLGWVSFQNDTYVLDLYGLGSDVARKARFANPASGEWMNSLAVAHDVRLAMIFPEWFVSVPCAWLHVGDLHLRGKRISVPYDYVSFYAVPPGDPAVIATQIKAFAPSLPAGVRFTLASPSEPNPYCAKP